MNINLFFETLIILFAILASNGIIYSLTIFNLNNLNKKNSSENISIITNSSEKDGLALTSLIASNPINLTSSNSSTSNTLSLTSSNSSTSDTGSGSLLESITSDNLSLTSLESNESDIIDNIENLLGTTYSTLDSVTFLNRETFLQ
jgi:hypothetical protein